MPAATPERAVMPDPVAPAADDESSSETPPPNATHASAAVESSAFDDLIALAGSLEAERHHDARLLSGRSRLPLIDTDDAEDADPLAALAREYQQTLFGERPTGLHDLKAAATTVDRAAPVAAAPDVFADLAEPGAPPSDGASVSDLLTKGRNIDALLESLDTFGASRLFEAEAHQEILSLFAPRGIQASRASQAAQLARAEHHLVSVDSHLAMPDPAKSDPSRAADDPYR